MKAAVRTAREAATSRRSDGAQFRGRPIEAVLFDLDGTLLDTAGDIALALNRAGAEHGWSPVADDAVRLMIGRGAPTLVTRAAAHQGVALSERDHASVLDRFFHHYGALQTFDECAASPYAGAVEALSSLHDAGLHIAVVTNKQQRFAIGLLQRLDLSGWVDLVVGGDTCERRKPDPQPLQYACAALEVDLDQAVMVGDSVNDVQAAKAAGIPVICVPYGYNEGVDPRSLPADAFVDTLADLPGLLLRPGA